MFFRIHNSLVLNKGLIYVNTTLKGETEGVLAFVIPVAQRHMVLNRVHQDASHQGQQWTLALTLILVAHDGRGLPSYSKGVPALPSIIGRSAKGSPLSD